MTPQCEEAERLLRLAQRDRMAFLVFDAQLDVWVARILTADSLEGLLAD